MYCTLYNSVLYRVIDKFHFLIHVFQQAATVVLHPVVDVSDTDSTGNVMQCVLYSTGSR